MTVPPRRTSGCAEPGRVDSTFVRRPLGLADVLENGYGDGEPGVDTVLAPPSDVGQQAVSAAGRVTADHDRGAVPIRVRDLGQRGVQHGDVVGGGVRPGVARSQQPGQGFPVASRKENSGW